MPRLFFGNFDFEHQLAENGGGAATALKTSLTRINAELAAAWLAVAEDGDLVWAPAGIDPAFLAAAARHGIPAMQVVTRAEQFVDLVATSSLACPPRPASKAACGHELCPWGWSAEMLAWGQAHGLTCRAPPLAAVRKANCRLFSLALETEWRVGLEGATAICSVDDLRRTISRWSPSARWVVKARFGMSARERILGRGSEVSAAAANWLRPRLARDGAVVFEPWVEKIAEAGIQMEVPERGAPVLLGVTPLMTDDSGNYRGNRFDLGDGETASDGRGVAHWEDGVEIALRAGARVQELGCFGPLGIDAIRYRDKTGAARLRPLQDINARWTMGRLSLGFRRLLAPGESAAWLHFPWQGAAESPLSRALTKFADELPTGARLLLTSPDHVAGQPTRHASTLLIAPSPHVLDEIVGRFQKSL